MLGRQDMLNSNLQRQEFHGRLKRIKKGAPNTFGQIYVGPQDEIASEAEGHAHFGVFRTILALMLGLVAYAIGHLAQYHLMISPETGMAADIGPSTLAVATNMGDLLVAVPVLLILLKLFRQSGFGPPLVGAMGLFLMMGLQAYTVEMAPDFYTALYSESYVTYATGG